MCQTRVRRTRNVTVHGLENLWVTVLQIQQFGQQVFEVGSEHLTASNKLINVNNHKQPCLTSANTGPDVTHTRPNPVRQVQIQARMSCLKDV